MKRRKSRKQFEQSSQLVGEKFIKKFVFISLLVMAAVIFFMRLHTFNEPYERDIASHAVISHELLDGRELYSDLWDSKPPAIFLSYGAGELIFGYGQTAIFALGIIAALVTLVGAYYAGKAFGGYCGGFWAAVFWTLVCSDLWLWANQPNIEVFINACLVWAIALVGRASSEKMEWKRWVGIGILFAAATVYKPVAVTFPVFIGLGYIAWQIFEKRSWKMSVVQVAITGGVGAVLWLGIFGYFAFSGRFEIFYDTVFKYGQYYTESRGGSLISNIIDGFEVERLFSDKMRSLRALALLAGVGGLAGLFTKKRGRWFLLIGFALGSQVAISLPGRFYAHYYQLWLVGVVVGGGFAVSMIRFREQMPQEVLRGLVGGVFALITVVMVGGQYKFSADNWSEKKYGPQFVISKRLGVELLEMMEDDEGLYVWGINPELYFWTKRRPAVGAIWSTDLIEGPIADAKSEKAAEKLESAKPDFIVVNIMQVAVPREHRVVEWILDNYVAIPGGGNYGRIYNRYLFKVLVRKESEAARRLYGS